MFSHKITVSSDQIGFSLQNETSQVSSNSKHVWKKVLIQSAFTCSKLTIWTYFTPCSSVSIVNFEHVNTDWEGSTALLAMNQGLHKKSFVNIVCWYELYFVKKKNKWVSLVFVSLKHLLCQRAAKNVIGFPIATTYYSSWFFD